MLIKESRVELVDRWYTGSFEFSSKKVAEGFRPSIVFSRQEGPCTWSALTENPHHPFALTRSLHANWASRKSLSAPKDWVSFITYDYVLPSNRWAKWLSSTHKWSLFPYSLLLEQGMKGIFIFSGEARLTKHCWRRLPRGFQRKSLPIYLTVD